MPTNSTTKRCPKCGAEKPRDAFAKSNRRDGLQTYCKECHRPMVNESSRAYREKPGIKEHYAELQRKRMEDPNDPYRQNHIMHHRTRRESEEAREQDRLFQRTRRQKPEVKQRVSEYNRELRKDPRQKAWKAVQRAIKMGVLPDPKTVPCSFPGCTQPARHYHHTSYDEEHWLDVQAVCPKHHGQLHWVSPS